MAGRERFGKIAICTERSMTENAPLKNRNRTNASSKKIKRFFVLGTFLSLILFFGLSIVTSYLSVHSAMQDVLEQNYNQLYGAAFVVHPGDRRAVNVLEDRLSGLGYQKVTEAIRSKTWLENEGEILVYPESAGQQETYQMSIEKNQVQLLTRQRDGLLLDRLELGRPLLTSFTHRIWELRYPLVYEQIPQKLVDAILATEDTSFFNHFGIDPRGIGRAALVNLKAKKIVQGGSTITQQLVKSLMGRTERKFAKKIEEASLALLFDFFYSKEEILTAYCNTIYLGYIGPFTVYGVAAAAQHFLGKKLQDLSPGECALLAGLIRSPNRLSPHRHPDAAKQRATVILGRMEKLGMVSSSVKVPNLLGIHKEKTELLARSWYYAAVKEEIDRRVKSNGSEQSFYLGMDPELQAAAGRQLDKKAGQLEARAKKSKERIEGAIVALDVETGAVRALVGGRDFTKSKFNRALQAERQIGSLVKPFVYMLALEKEGKNRIPFQLREVDDRPLVHHYDGDKRTWRPKNFDHKYLGTISNRRALITSRNIPAVLQGEKVGLAPLSSLLKELEVADIKTVKPAVYLGAIDSTPVKMAGAYRALAAGGEFVRPFMLEGVSQKSKWPWVKSEKIVQTHRTVKQLLDPVSSYIITDMLKGVLTEGTGRSAKKYQIDAEVAGKTGTSSDMRDGWFAGYSPKLTMVTWMGRDQGKPMGFTGGSSSLHPWAALMKEFGGNQTTEFEVPPQVKFVALGEEGRDIAYAEPRWPQVIAESKAETPEQSLSVVSLLTALGKVLQKKDISRASENATHGSNLAEMWSKVAVQPVKDVTVKGLVSAVTPMDTKKIEDRLEQVKVGLSDAGKRLVQVISEKSHKSEVVDKPRKRKDETNLVSVVKKSKRVNGVVRQHQKQPKQILAHVKYVEEPRTQMVSPPNYKYPKPTKPLNKAAHTTTVAAPVKQSKRESSVMSYGQKSGKTYRIQEGTTLLPRQRYKYF